MSTADTEARPAPARGTYDGPRDVRVLIIGTGFSGLGAAQKLREDGIDDFLLLERADDVGGTWRDNTYPGAACDVPSQLYSFSFQLNPEWTRSFSEQPEIHAYLRSVADRLDLWPRILLRHEMTAAHWDDDAGRWRVETTQGDFSAQFLVSGAGALSDPSIPDIPGLDTFEGEIWHSARWNHDYDLRGKRVAVVGTGASAIQFVPRIQPEVEHLTLFQRTPPWIIPRLDRKLWRWEQRLYARFPRLQRAVRAAVYGELELRAIGFTKKPDVLRVAEVVARGHLRRQVRDPALREKLTPDYKIGCKRILIASEYYPSLTQPNVTVVPAGLSEVRPRAVVGSDGQEQPADAIIFGTGFRVTDPPVAYAVHGRDGVRLVDSFEDGGMQAHLGTTVPGFPNFFWLMGPNTGLGHTSQVFMIEQQIEMMSRALAAADARGADVVEVKPETLERFSRSVQERSQETVWIQGGCGSWYLDDAGRNVTTWPDFTFTFRKEARGFDPDAYALVSHAGGRGTGTERSAVEVGT